MKISYPGISVPLDTTQSQRFKGEKLDSLSGQTYFKTKSNEEPQQSKLDIDFINKQKEFNEKDWDSERNSFTFHEYSSLDTKEKLQLTKLHAIRWHYGLLLADSCAHTFDENIDNEKKFVQTADGDEETKKLYAGWYINQLESNGEKVTSDVKRLFKKEMQLTETVDLSPYENIAKKKQMNLEETFLN